MGRPGKSTHAPRAQNVLLIVIVNEIKERLRESALPAGIDAAMPLLWHAQQLGASVLF